MTYLLLKYLHVLSATILFGTGIGSAFYFLCACISRDAKLIGRVASWVVRADWMFTATTVVLQPLTGWLLMRTASLPVETYWILLSIALYVLAVACWLPVVWLQIKMRDIALHSADNAAALPPVFHRYFITWFALGIPSLIAFLAIFYLMVAKPSGA